MCTSLHKLCMYKQNPSYVAIRCQLCPINCALWQASLGCTVSNKTVSMFAQFAFTRPHLHEYSSEMHDSSFTGKPCISPFRGCAHHVITIDIRQDMLATLERQHWISFVAYTFFTDYIRLLVLCVAFFGLDHCNNPPKHALHQIPANWLWNGLPLPLHPLPQLQYPSKWCVVLSKPSFEVLPEVLNWIEVQRLCCPW